MTQTTVTGVEATFCALIDRLRDDRLFVEDIRRDARGTMEREGLLMDKEEVESFVASNPARFTELADAFLDSVDQDLLRSLGAIASTCGMMQ